MLNVYGYFKVVAVLLKKRLGVFFGLVWIGIGITLVYNIVFNHFWTMVIRPGSPKDLIDNEILRKEVKQRENRKAARVVIEGDAGAVPNEQQATEDDRFEGLQKDVKRLIKYRTKTMGNLRGVWNANCSHCDELKPARTHHCSVTDQCVF